MAGLLATLVAAPLPLRDAADTALHAQDPGTLLRLQPRPGEALTYRFEQDIEVHMPPEFGGSQRIGHLLVLRQTAQRVVRDTIHYMSEVRDLALDLDQEAEAGGLDLSALRGQRVRMAVSPRGEILALELLGDAPSGSEELQQAIRQLGFPVLPAGPVRVGDTWTDTTRMAASAMVLPADGEVVSVHRAELRGLRDEGGRTVADLRVRTTFRFEPGARATPGMNVELTGSRTEELRFDVGRGRFLGSTGTQEFHMRMAIPGTAGSLSIRGTVSSRASLVGS